MKRLLSFIFSGFKNAWKRLREGVFVLFSGENKRARDLAASLDSIEKVPLLFARGRPSTTVAKMRLEEAAGFLKAQKEFSRLFPDLQRKAVALAYRLGKRYGGEDPLELPDKATYSFLALQAAYEGFTLSRQRRTYLEKVSRYPLFSNLLKTNPKILEAFFKWSLRDGVPPDVFIEYPSIAEKLQKSFLSERIGVLGKRSLKITRETFENGVVLKDVVLLFEGKEISILDDNERVQFSNAWIMNLKEVWDIFSKKDIAIGDLEFFRNGITNWNAFLLGRWNEEKKRYQPIDITVPFWWKQLPIIEILTQDEAEKRYGYRPDGIHWNIAATATRLKHNLDYNGSHAFFEVAIPIGDGRYSVYPFGKFAKRIPKSFADVLSFFCHTVPATVAYPDPNVFYTERKRAWQSFAVNSEEGYRFLEAMRKEILKSRQNSMVYQIESENCAKWTQEILEGILGKKAVPDLYRISLLDTLPGGVMQRIFNILKKLPGSWPVKLFTFLHLPLRPWVGSFVWKEGKRIFLSLLSHEFFETSLTHLPGMLHELQESVFKSTFFNYVSKSFEKFYSYCLAHRLKKASKKQGGDVFCQNSAKKPLYFQFLQFAPPGTLEFLYKKALLV